MSSGLYPEMSRSENGYVYSRGDVEFEVNVTHFKIMTNNVNNHYFVYTDVEKNFNVRRYIINESALNTSIEIEANLNLTKAIRIIVVQ